MSVKRATGFPLQGKRIVVTRAREQAAGLVERLRELGAEPLECPAISIAPVEDYTLLDAAIARLDSYDWVIFTSVNGVRAFVSRLSAAGKSLSDLCTRRIAAIGPATEAELRAIGCAPAFVPGTYVAEAIVEQIQDVEGKRVLLPRAGIARRALATGLRRRGASVDEVAAYRTVHAGDLSLVPLLSDGSVDAVTFTSSSTVRYTVEGMVDAGRDRAAAVEMLNRAAIVCIGPVTAATAADMGLRVSAVANEYTTEGLVDALIALFAGAEPVGSSADNRKGDH